MKRSAKFLLVLICIIVLTGVLILLAGRLISGRRQQNRISDVERYAITRSELTLTAIGSGKITSADTKNVLPQGNITEVKVKTGDYIKKGDLLAYYTNINGIKNPFLSEYDGIITGIPSGVYDVTTGKPAASMISISNPEKLQLDIQVTEKDIYKIKKGQSASIYIDAINTTVEGSVSRVSLAGKTSGDFSVYDVTVEFVKHDENIYLGMTGSAKIAVMNKKDVFKVPVDAIIEVDRRRYVLKSEWLNSTNRPQSDFYLEVKTGIADSDYVEILEGISQNMEILIVPKNNTSYLLF